MPLINCLKGSAQKDSSPRSQIFSASYKGDSNDNNSEFSYVPENGISLAENHLHSDDSLLVVPSEDDIKKSVFLNQDGSRTVEMRVRFKIKEEETIKWTTTVKHVGLSGDIDNKAVVEQSPESNTLTCKTSTEAFNSTKEDCSLKQTGTDMINKGSACGLETSDGDIWQNASMNISLSQGNNENVKPCFYRPPTPGPRRVRQKKASTESVSVVSGTAVQKQTVGPFSYNEEIHNDESKSENCMVTYSTGKTSSVNNPKLSAIGSNHEVKQSLEKQREKRMLTQVDHKATTENAAGLACEDVLLWNSLQKSFVEEGLHSSLTSNSYAQSSARNCQASKQRLANQSNVSEREPKSFNMPSASEGLQSKHEGIIRSQCKLSHSSQGSIHFSSAESNEQISQRVQVIPKVTESSPIMTKNAQYVTTSFLSNDSQSTSSNSKKKKKKKRESSSDVVEQGTVFQKSPCNINISVEESAEDKIKACEMHVTKRSTKHSSAEIIIQKSMLSFPVGNSDDTIEKLGSPEDLYHQVSMKPGQNKLGSNLKKKLNRQLPQIRNKSNQKMDLLPSIKAKEDLLLRNQHLKSKGTIKLMEQPPINRTLLNTLNETGSDRKFIEAGKITLGRSHESSKEQKKAKKSKRRESVLGNRVKMSDGTGPWEALSKKEFPNKIVEYSLENYVQSWLQNTFANAVMPTKTLVPINANERKMTQLSVKTFSDKDQLLRTNVSLMRNNSISEGKLANTALSHLREIEAVEESVKKLYERSIDSLTGANASLVKESKHLLQSDSKQPTKLSMCNIVHENNRQKTLSEIENRGLISNDSTCTIETDAKPYPKSLNTFVGTDVPEDQKGDLLLRHLKSVMLNIKKIHTDGIKKSCCLTDISPCSLLEPSSNLRIVWLPLLNHKESLSNTCKAGTVQTTCNCSEIIMLLQRLNQLIVEEQAEGLKDAVSDLQDDLGNHVMFSGMQVEQLRTSYCPDNSSLVETKNSPDFEQGQLNKSRISNQKLNSEEATEAQEMTEDSERQKKCSMSADNSNKNDLDVHNTLLHSLNNTHVEPNNGILPSNEKLTKENKDSSLQESQVRNTDTSFMNEELEISGELPKKNEKSYLKESLGGKTDTSFNDEESGLSVEPNSTISCITSNERDYIFDLETLELDDKVLRSMEGQECKEPLCENENSTGQLTLTNETASKSGREENCLEEDMEKDGPLLITSPPSSCHGSKQISVDAYEDISSSIFQSKSRVKMMVKKLDCVSYSNSSLEFKKSLKSPATSDLSVYQPDTEENDYSCKPSSDVTNESAEEAIYERKYNPGHIKRAIEQLYGKAKCSFRPVSQSGSPYMFQMPQNDAEETFHTVMENVPSLCRALNSWTDEKMSLLTSHEIPEETKTSSTISGKDIATFPEPQFSCNGEDAHYDDNYSNANQYCQSKEYVSEGEGILIDKGRCFLRENHFIRKSTPGNTGVHDNIGTTPADTGCDNHSDNVRYSHFGNLDLQPAFRETLSSESENLSKTRNNGCSYFNIPHNSDSETFPDDLSIKSETSQYGNTLTLESARKVCPTATHQCTDVNTNSPTFTSVDFRLLHNRVNSLEQLSNDKPIKTQPMTNGNSNRNSLEDRDSLDKLHAICGQHCPILTALIKATNEESKGFAYQKASDVENQVGLPFWLTMSDVIWQDKDVIGLDNSHAAPKNSCINKIANNIFDRLYADNTLDFINSNNFNSLVSAALKEKKSLKKSYARGNTNANEQAIHNHDNATRREALNETKLGQNNNLSVLQNSRGNVNQIVGGKMAPFADVTEDCVNENLYDRNIDWNETINMESENILSIEKPLSHETDEENGSDHSDC